MRGCYEAYQRAKRRSRSDGHTPCRRIRRLASLIEYPSEFPIKVMGAHVEGFARRSSRSHAASTPASTPRASSCRPSSAGNYLGITLTVTATSREQLDALYRR